MRLSKYLVALGVAGAIVGAGAPAWAPTAVEYQYSLLIPAVNQGRPIEISSFQWGAGRGELIGLLDSPPPGVNEIVVSKSRDMSSPGLFRSLAGRHFDNAVLYVRKAGRTYEYDLTDVSFASISSGGDRPSESLSLNFGRVERKNVGMGDGSVRGAVDGSVRPGNPWAAP